MLSSILQPNTEVVSVCYKKFSFFLKKSFGNHAKEDTMCAVFLRIKRNFQKNLPFHDRQRRQTGDYLDQILLVGHDLVDILVSTCGFIKVIL